MEHWWMATSPPELYQQVLVERMELFSKRNDDWVQYQHAFERRSYENVNKILEWTDEVDQYLVETERVILDKTIETCVCINMIARIRRLRAKHGADFTYRKAPSLLSSCQEFFCERALLEEVRGYEFKDAYYKSNRQRDKLDRDLVEWLNEVDKFLRETEPHVVIAQIPETNSDWYCNKIAETRTILAKRDPAFSFQSEHVGSSSINLPTMESKAHVDDAGCSKSKEMYQIFLSFRGEDTRYNFTDNLYHALHQEGFKIFMDDRGLQRGDSISQVIMEAIENSKLSIIVFSENFADSVWCLDEVVKIIECRHKNNQLVWPIFYKVEPSDVRHQRNNYEKAMVKHERRHGNDSEMVQNWRSALYQVCGFRAFHYKENSGMTSSNVFDVGLLINVDVTHLFTTAEVVIAVGHVGHVPESMHYVLLALKRNHPMPPIAPWWQPYAHPPFTDWYAPYGARCEAFVNVLNAYANLNGSRRDEETIDLTDIKED